MTYQHAFPTLILNEKVVPSKSPLVQELTEEAYLIAEKDNAGRNWSKDNYPKGFTSYGSLDQLHRFSSSFGKLEKKLQVSLKKFLVKSQLDLRPSDLHLTRMWVNVMGSGSSHPFHIHPHSVISGSFYLQMPKDAPGIKFEDPRMSSMMARPALRDKAKAEMKNYLTVKPTPGEIVLFESWLKHEVPSHHGSLERISVSFNFDWNRS